jgi:hypothetical protein
MVVSLIGIGAEIAFLQISWPFAAFANQNSTLKKSITDYLGADNVLQGILNNT